MNNTFIEQAPKIIPVLQDDKGFWANIIIALITLLAVIVALFQEWIKDYFNKSVIDMQIILAPPDCHQIILTQTDRSVVSSCIYLRIKVVHKKGKAGQNVELMLTNFWSVDKNGRKRVIKEFLPMNLVWSHFQPRRTESKIPVSLFRHCDLGSIRPINNGALLVLDTMVQPNPVSGGVIPNVIEPGRYRFEVLLSGDNVTPLTKRWELEFPNEYTENEENMLRKMKIRQVI